MNNQNETPLPPSEIQFSVKELASLAFGPFADRFLPDQTAQSTTLGDYNKVVITHLYIGKKIIALDPFEHEFHVELYTTHAELWTRFDWDQSNARRKRLKDNLDKERGQREDTRNLELEVADAISGLKIVSEVQCKLWAKTIVDCPNIEAVKPILERLGVYDAVKKIKEKYKK